MEGEHRKVATMVGVHKATVSRTLKNVGAHPYHIPIIPIMKIINEIYIEYKKFQIKHPSKVLGLV